jgi:hypothetical protein
VTVSFVVYGVILLFVMGQKAMYTDLIREALGRNRSAAAA